MGTTSARYDDRGWTLFESILIDGKAPSPKINEKDRDFNWGELNVVSFGDDFDPEAEDTHGWEFLQKFAKGERRPPCSPERFVRQMKAREQQAKDKKVDFFTSGADQDFVIQKYNKASEEQAQATKFDFSEMGWGDDEMESLAEVLVKCKDL